MERLILTDCDGCLVDWNKGFEAFMEMKKHPKVPNTDHDYSMAIRHNMSHKDVHKYIKEFNESPYIADLEPFADSVEYVERLVGKGFKFIVVTSISNAPQAKYYRTKNLINLFGDVFDEIHCLEMGISKAAELEKWSDTGYFWIEDHMRQAEAGFEAGLKTVLISHPYNSHYETDLFPKVSFKQPWKEIYNMVCKEYGLNAD
jgi:FMN phosphatase YigB (HAD superfamily)